MQILNLKERYPFTCECGEKVDAAPSIFMTGFQQNMGGIHCPKCKKHNFVAIADDNTKMIERDVVSAGALPSKCYRKATKNEEQKINDREHGSN